MKNAAKLILIVLGLGCLPAQAQELGKVLREVPDQICVYVVSRAGNTELKKGDIVTVHSSPEEGEAWVMSVSPDSFEISLKGVFDVAVGDEVSFSRAANKPTGDWGQGGADAGTAKPIPIPPGFQSVTLSSFGCRLGMPSSMSENNRGATWVAYKNYSGDTVPRRTSPITISVSRSSGTLESKKKEYDNGMYTGDAWNYNSQEGSIEIDGKTYQTFKVTTSQKQVSKGIHRGEFFFIFLDGEYIGVQSWVSRQQDIDLVERARRSLTLL